AIDKLDYQERTTVGKLTGIQRSHHSRIVDPGECLHFLLKLVEDPGIPDLVIQQQFDHNPAGAEVYISRTIRDCEASAAKLAFDPIAIHQQCSSEPLPRQRGIRRAGWWVGAHLPPPLTNCFGSSKCS